MNEDQMTDAAEREMDLYRDEITRLRAAHEAEIASLTEQRNRVSDTADRLRGQLRAVKVVADQHALGDTPRAILAQAVLEQMDADL